MGKVWFSFTIHCINVQLRDVHGPVAHDYLLLLKTYKSFPYILFGKAVSPEMRCPGMFRVVGFLEKVCVWERMDIPPLTSHILQNSYMQFRILLRPKYINEGDFQIRNFQMLEVNQVEEKSKVLMEMINARNALLSRCSCYIFSCCPYRNIHSLRSIC